MRLFSLDQSMQDTLINFSVWEGISAPDGHLKLVLKVTPPPEKGMMGISKYHRENIKWNGTRKSLRQAILTFLSSGAGKESDIKQAMFYVKNLFI